jgi:hypothetical protein
MNSKAGKSTSGQSHRSIEHGAQELASEAKEAVQQVKDRVKEGATEAVDEVKHQARSAVHDQKEFAAERLSSVSEALHDSANRLREDEAVTFASLIEQAADRIDGFSQYIREQDITDMIDAAQNWARRNPALFLGGSFVLGLVIARLVKSTSQARPDYDEYESMNYGRSNRPREAGQSRFGSQQYGGSAFTPQSSGVTEPGNTPGSTAGWEEP